MAKYPGQIRIGNRQDEPIVRPLIAGVLGKTPEDLELSASDKDLRNIEQAYFGAGGLFLIAERDGAIVGLLAANESEHNGRQEANQLYVKRLYVFDESKAGELVARALLKVLDNFACVSDHNRLILPASLPDASKFARLSGFCFDQSQGFYFKELALPCFGSLELRLKAQEAVASFKNK